MHLTEPTAFSPISVCEWMKAVVPPLNKWQIKERFIVWVYEIKFFFFCFLTTGGRKKAKEGKKENLALSVFNSQKGGDSYATGRTWQNPPPFHRFQCVSEWELTLSVCVCVSEREFTSFSPFRPITCRTNLLANRISDGQTNRQTDGHTRFSPEKNPILLYIVDWKKNF